VATQWFSGNYLGAIFILRKGVLSLFWTTHQRKDIFTT
jgi:hypothetical protein